MFVVLVLWFFVLNWSQLRLYWQINLTTCVPVIAKGRSYKTAILVICCTNRKIVKRAVEKTLSARFVTSVKLIRSYSFGFAFITKHSVKLQ